MLASLKQPLASCCWSIFQPLVWPAVPLQTFLRPFFQFALPQFLMWPAWRVSDSWQTFFLPEPWLEVAEVLPQVSMADFLLVRMEQQRKVSLCLRELQALTKQSSQSSAALEGEPVSRASSSEETAIPRTDPLHRPSTILCRTDPGTVARTLGPLRGNVTNGRTRKPRTF